MKNKKILTTGFAALLLLFVSINLKAEVKKYVRYVHNDSASFGLLEGETVYQLEKAPYLGGEKTGKEYNLEEIRLLAPVEPSKVLAVGFNYHSHRGDMELPPHPPIFLKLSSAIIGSDEKLSLIHI